MKRNKGTIVGIIIFAVLLIANVFLTVSQTRDITDVKQTIGVSEGFHVESEDDDYVFVDGLCYYFDQGTPVDSDELKVLLAEGANVKVGYVADGMIVVSLEVEGEQIYTAEQYLQHFKEWQTRTPILLGLLLVFYLALFIGLPKLLNKAQQKDEQKQEENKKRPLSDFDKFEIGVPKALSIVCAVIAVMGIAVVILMVVLQIMKLAEDAFVPCLIFGACFALVGAFGWYATKREKFTLKDGVYTYRKVFGEQSISVTDVAYVEIIANIANAMRKVIFWDTNGNKAISFLDDGTSFKGGEFELSLKYAKIPHFTSVNYKSSKNYKQLKQAMVALWLESNVKFGISANFSGIGLHKDLDSLAISLQKGVYTVGWYKDMYTEEQVEALTEEQLQAYLEAESEVVEEHTFNNFDEAFACAETIAKKLLG